MVQSDVLVDSDLYVLISLIIIGVFLMKISVQSILNRTVYLTSKKLYGSEFSIFLVASPRQKLHRTYCPGKIIPNSHSICACPSAVKMAWL